MTTFALVNNGHMNTFAVLETITDRHFGTNLLITHVQPTALTTASGLGAGLVSTGATGFRYPGGSVTEFQFNMATPNATVSPQGLAIIPQSQFLSFAAQASASVNFVIPTREGFAQDAWTALGNGTYGNRVVTQTYLNTMTTWVQNAIAAATAQGVTIDSFEIGNEFWGSGQMTAREYGKLAAAVLQAAQNGINAAINAGTISASAQPDLLVQTLTAVGLFSPNGPSWVKLVNGTIVEAAANEPGARQIAGLGSSRDQLYIIMDEIKAANRQGLIDGLVDHYYTRDGLTDVDAEDQYIFNQFTKGEERLGFARGTLDRYVTEWNTKSDAADNRGMPQAAMLVEMMYEMATNGVTDATIWPSWFPNANGTALLDSATFGLRVPGAMFRLMAESLPGTTPLFDATASVGASVLDTHGFASGTELVMFASNRGTAPITNTVLNLNQIGNSTFQARLDQANYFILTTQLTASLNGVIGKWAGTNDNPVPVVAVGNGRVATGDTMQIGTIQNWGIVRVEVTWITQGNDLIEGRTGNDVMQGEGGNDTLRGGAGSDVLNGDAGSDRLEGGSGADSLFGGSEGDLLYGGADNDRLSGGDGNDTLYGGAGNDFFYGGNNNDLLYGDDGNDTLGGGGGNDTLYGGAGIDTGLFSGAVAGTIDLAITTAQATGHGTDILLEIENLQTGSLADRVWGNADANRLETFEGNDTVDGRAGNDVILAGAGLDIVYGGDGNDSLDGGADNDQLFGGTGNDTMIGGLGADTQSGGLGNDRFVFSATNQFGDRITDFANASGNNDEFYIARSIGGGLAAGALAATQFLSSTGNVATTAAHRFIFNTATDTLWFDADGVGGQAGVLVATVIGADVTAADIFLF